MDTAQNSPINILLVSNAETGINSGFLKKIVKLAAASSRARYKDEIFDSELCVIDVLQALSTRSKWREVVKALCQATIVLIDTSNFAPAAMMLLGVRSVVRRGITLTLMVNEAELPWNIRETKPVCLQEMDIAKASERLSSTLEDAWKRYSGDTHFSDLPVYDAIRSLPQGDYSAIGPTDQVLVLCSFSKEYDRRNWHFLKDTLQSLYLKLEEYNDRTFEEIKVIRTLDMHSTTLVSEALYDAIRRCTWCIVDWTDWRPSVFFELGVRLAASRIDPICLIESVESPSSPTNKQTEAMAKLFSPIQYQVEHDTGLIDQIFEQFDSRFDAHLRLDEANLASDTSILPCETYETVVDAIEVEDDETIVTPLHIQLRKSAQALLGDPSRGAHPMLFAENKNIRELHREAAIERLLAAWFYLTRRYTDDQLRSASTLGREAYYIGRTILLEIRESSQEEGMRNIIADILERLKRMKVSDQA